MDSSFAIQMAPRVTQALLAVAHDVALSFLVSQHFPAAAQSAAIVVSSLSWFNCFTHARMFSNCLESTIHLACLAVWPRAELASNQAAYTPSSSRRVRRSWAIALAGACCVIRPTSAVLFLPLAIQELLPLPSCSAIRSAVHRCSWNRHWFKTALQFFLDAILLAVLIASLNALIDTCFYGRFVLPAWTNVRFNVIDNNSASYGTHPWHWYFTHGITAMLASLLPAVIWGIVRSICGRDSLNVPLWPLGLGLWGICVHSLLPHKEFRFILPSFELLLLYAAVPWMDFVGGATSCCHDSNTSTIMHTKNEVTASWAPNSVATLVSARAKMSQEAVRLRKGLTSASTLHRTAEVQRARSRQDGQKRRSSSIVAVVWWVCVALQLPILAYFGLVHQRGTIAVMEHLSRASLAPVRSGWSQEYATG
jgi:GPI mannosyltransferase 3